LACMGALLATTRTGRCRSQSDWRRQPLCIRGRAGDLPRPADFWPTRLREQLPGACCAAWNPNWSPGICRLPEGGNNTV